MNGLITESLKQGNTRFLVRMKDDLLTKTEKKWLHWISEYTIRYGQPPSLQRFADEFTTSFVQVESPDPLADLFEQAIKDKKNIAVRKYIQENVEALQNGDDPSDLIEKLHKLIAINTSGLVETTTFDRSVYFRDVDRVFTGLPTMDEATGGINDGDLVYIVGRPQDGKTTLLLHMIARWFWEGKNVLVISNEIPWIDMLFKIDAILAGVNVGEKRSGKFKPESRQKLQFLQYITSIMPNKIVIPDRPIRKPSEVVALIQEHKPDIVCIDGAYLMSMTGAATVEWTELAAVSRELKMIANMHEIPVIGVIQANRSASEKSTVGGENIAGSDAFFQDPDIVFSVRSIVGGSAGLTKQVNMSTTKNRHGVAASIQLEYDFISMTLKEVI